MKEVVCYRCATRWRISPIQAQLAGWKWFSDFFCLCPRCYRLDIRDGKNLGEPIDVSSRSWAKEDRVKGTADKNA